MKTFLDFNFALEKVYHGKFILTQIWTSYKAWLALTFEVEWGLSYIT